jgi:hypothetical protein
VTPLTIEDVSRIHFRGGSQIGISRANPTTKPELLENAVHSLLRLGVSQLITIGGDDTAFSAMKLLERAEGRLRVVHVPKTIDNDLDLPPYVDTFGFPNGSPSRGGDHSRRLRGEDSVLYFGMRSLATTRARPIDFAIGLRSSLTPQIDGVQARLDRAAFP